MSESPAIAKLECCQCGKRALWMVNDAPLCVECRYKVELTQHMREQRAAAMYNLAAAEIDEMSPFGPATPRMQMPRAPMPPISYNHQSVQVTDSTVGAINLGHVAGSISVDLQAVTEAGGIEAAEELARFTQLVLNSNEMNERARAELVEQIAIVAQQARVPKAGRKPGLIKAVLLGVKDTAASVASVASAWQSVEPVVKGWFNLS